ncbi:glutamate--tRNA ligase [Zhaonella formicivorans]|uniref:glutamate--tRNA ligase n=1 Tax=Zhaonella formicivorans TaxID=2528593 RepID=UPI0010D9CF2F|nr:glutamate--tRNA ligase [Zhaonella formicivorans]
MERVRLRFAPSPTGPLHIGGARSALFNYLLAKKAGGDFILRIEDTDLERSSRESEENIKESLRWLGIEWNEGIDVGGGFGPYRQTERLDIYRHYVDKLLEAGLAYRCYCSEEELERERKELMERGQLPRYLGKCRNLSCEQEEEYKRQGRKPVIRFRVPENETIVINDLVRGEVTFESSGIGDFVIVKSDGIPTYNFAVVIDDVTMGITHIIRGEEHLSNTPRQVLLYRALQFKEPQFAHISLILGKDRTKMSKRHGSTSVVNYREAGYLPEALVNFLALLGWSPEGEEEIFSMEQLIQQFSLDRVAKNPAVFDMDKLKWINGYYIRQSSVERITDLAIPYLQEAGLLSGEIDAKRYEWLKKMVSAVKNKIACLSEISEHAAVFFPIRVDIVDDEAKVLVQEEQVPEVMRLLVRKLREAGELTPENVKGILKAITKELNLGGKKVFMPIRIALTGRMHGPELHDLIPLIGVNEVVRRIKQSLQLNLD